MKYIVAAIVLCCLTGCKWFGHDDPQPEDDTWSKVMILYSAGFNSLSEALKSDIEDLKSGYLPGEKDRRALIIVGHHTKVGSIYQNATSPQIIRLYKDKKNRPVMDTLKTYSKTDLLSVPSVMEDALTYVRDNFKSEHYGLILSSHGTGWLPEGYYADPESSTVWWAPRRDAVSRRMFQGGGVPYVEEVLPGPAVKSFGQEIVKASSSSQSISYEMDIRDLAGSIPMHLDYLMFDVCLMGGVEVAYELKDVCDRICFSQTEVLDEGFDYENITMRLLAPKTADPGAVCKDFYDYYMAQSGEYRSATISMIDCSGLDALASACKDIFAAHRTELAALKPSAVQGYFRFRKHWFYDLEDILVKAGMTSSESARLQQALSSCVVYKAHTPQFFGADIKTHCGLSMYLPCDGSDKLDSYYRSLAWNRAAGLVE